MVDKQSPESLIALGYEARRKGRLEGARGFFSGAVRFSRAAANPQELAASLTGLGQIERDLKNNSVALRCYREAVDIYRRGPDRQRFAHTIRHLADILRHEGSSEEAGACYEEALNIYRTNGETKPLDLANAIRGYALLKEILGQKSEAKTLWQEARMLYESVHVEAGVKESESRVAKLTAQ